MTALAFLNVVCVFGLVIGVLSAGQRGDVPAVLSRSLVLLALMALLIFTAVAA